MRGNGDDGGAECDVLQVVDECGGKAVAFYDLEIVFISKRHFADDAEQSGRFAGRGVEQLCCAVGVQLHGGDHLDPEVDLFDSPRRRGRHPPQAGVVVAPAPRQDRSAGGDLHWHCRRLDSKRAYRDAGDDPANCPKDANAWKIAAGILHLVERDGIG